MIVADLHPEDLLDREARGELAPKEREMLDAHLSHCPACRLEREVRLDFADEMDGSDMPSHDGSLLVSRVLARAEAPPAKVPAGASTGTRAAGATGGAPQTEEIRAAIREEIRAAIHDENEKKEDVKKTIVVLRARSPQRLRLAVLVAAALTLASAAGASRLSGMWASSSASESSSGSMSETTVPTTIPRAASHAMPARDFPSTPNVLAASADDPMLPSAPEPLATAVPFAAPVDVPARPRARMMAQAPASPAATIVPVVAMTPPEPLPAPLAAPPAPLEDEFAAPALFSRANAARRRGDHGRAVTMYRDLLSRHPDAAEASATRVALGRVLLDDGDAAGALPLFETYLNGGDVPLREEAMVGRARAFERLGRVADERAAWTALVQGYPQSIHAARARARLEELGHR